MPPAGSVERTELMELLTEYVLTYCLVHGEKNLLRDVLALHCPETYPKDEAALEIGLAFPPPYSVKPFPVLYEAYKSSKIEAAKRNILRAFQRAFPEFVQEGQEADVFLEKCLNWFNRNDGHLTLNDRYFQKYSAQRGTFAVFRAMRFPEKPGAVPMYILTAAEMRR